MTLSFPPAGRMPHRSMNAPAGTASNWKKGKSSSSPTPPFDVSEEERKFLLAQRPSGSRLHKNVSYRPAEDVLRGFTAEEPTQSRMHQAMRNYSTQVIRFLTRFLAPYAGQWLLDYASFRPFEEQGRDLPLHKRNDLLHVDAFPSLFD